MKEIQPENRLSNRARTAEVTALVERIGASTHFRRAERLRLFLEFVCKQTLDGKSSEIHEQLIGHEVFGRAADYDPSSDNIVRVEARELRKRLAAYFTDEGAGEPIAIRIPKGGYVPVFEDEAIPEPVNEAAAEPVAAPRRFDTRFLIAGLTALVIVLAAALVFTRYKSPAPVLDTQPQLPPLFASFWSRIFELDRPVVVCLADSNLSILQDLRGEAISFEDYTSGRYFAALKDAGSKPGVDQVLSEIASRYYTSLADASTLARLMMLNQQHRPVTIRFARDLNLRDLKSRNAILLGSERSTPWVGLFNPKRRFRIEYDTSLHRVYLRDSSPEQGRPSIYMCDQAKEGPYESYGIVAAVPNLDGTGHAILIAGTNMQGTEAAGEFLTNPAKLDAFLTKIKWRADRPLPTFEVVLKLVTMGGSSTANQIFAYEARGI